MHRILGMGGYLACLILSLSGAAIAYHVLDFPLSYTSFTASEVTWRGVGKARDIAAVFSFVVLLPSSVYILGALKKRVMAGVGAINPGAFDNFLAMCSLPAAVYMGQQLIVGKAVSMGLVLSNGLAITSGCFVFLYSCRRRVYEDAYQLGVIAFANTSLCAIGLLVIPVIEARLGGRLDAGRAGLYFSLSTVGAALWSAGLIYAKSDLRRYLATSLILFQGLSALFYIIMIPMPVFFPREEFRYPANALLYMTFIALVVFALLDLRRRRRRLYDLDLPVSSLFSPLCIAPVLLVFVTLVTRVPAIPSDDYHFGEQLLPLYMWQHYGLLPYSTYSPPHGFVDMLPAVAAKLFLSQKAAYLGESTRILYALLVLALFFTAVRPLGIVLALLTALAGGLARLEDIASIILLLTIWKTVGHKAYGVVVIFGSALLFLLSPGQGGAFALAFVPVAVYWSWVNWNLRRDLVVMSCSVLVGAGIIAMVPSLWKIIVGIIRYVMENASANLAAYGVPWDESWPVESRRSGVLFEFVRFSWVLLPILGVFLIRKRKPDENIWRQPYLPLIVGAAVYLILISKYSVGRIDPDALSRPGLTSLVAFSIAVLLVKLFPLRREGRAMANLSMAVWLGALCSVAQGGYGDLQDGMVCRCNNQSPVDLDKSGFYGIGKGLVEQGEESRLNSLQRLGRIVMDRDETFLDLTNRNALYYYLGRPIPVEGAPYNMPVAAMQLRSIDRLSRNVPPLALVSADSLNHDGKSLAVRTHLLYRWVIQHYIPVLWDNMVVGIRPDRWSRLKAESPGVGKRPDSAKALDLWDKAFRLTDFSFLPVSWGRSYDTLERNMDLVRSLKISRAGLQGVRRLSDTRFVVSGPDPYVYFSLQGGGFSGRDAGLLSMDFACDSGGSPVLAVYWRADNAGPNEEMVVRFQARDGRLIVPLDALPRWLLARKIQLIRIDVETPAACGTFSIKNVKLFQRRYVGQMAQRRASVGMLRQDGGARVDVRQGKPALDLR